MQTHTHGKTLLLFVFLLAISACEPIGPMPGGGLSGNVATYPSSWSALNASEVVQLEVNGPYSVNIWGVGVDRGYYVAAGKGSESKWTRKIAQNSAVRLRIAETIYELTAIKVDDDDELKTVLEAYRTKYELEASEDFPDAILYRLEAR
tara:strand:- start:2288 stop:2734 length:447 start_codon:yes stop_codon:yes gene_type:complete